MSAAIHDLNREVSLQLLKSVRAFAVRTPKGQKDHGHFKWDPRTNNKELSDQTLFNLERSDDNLGVHLFGPVVDVDVDTDNPFLIQALDHFLPPTAHVWGRASRPRTHRLYELSGAKAEFDPSMFPFLAVIQAKESIAVEVRGGELRNGKYSLLPGSVHPSGETYEWTDLKAARSTPVAADVHRIVNGVRYACVAALIAPYWTEGVRNQLCMALSGFFYRASSHVSEMGSASALEFSYKEAKELLTAILLIADDDPSDKIMRLKTFDQTWEKAEQGTAVSGATTIAKITGDEELITLLYTLLADSPDMVELDKFMERYAIRNGSSTIIDVEKAGSKVSKYVMTVQDFTNSSMHMTIKSASGGKVPMTAILMRSPRAIRVEGMCFIPNDDKLITQKEGKFVNQWCGWGIDMSPEPVPADDPDIKLFKDYVYDVVADGDLGLGHWILSWIADIFRNPGSKPGTALVLVGLPGAGKSMIGEKVLRPIIGSTHSAQTNDVESLTSNFNSDSANLLFMQCDEAMNSRRRSDANKLKSMITDHTRRVEFKFADAFASQDFVRYLLTSNDEEDAVAITDGENDRRYTVARVSDKYATGYKGTTDAAKIEYWRALYSSLEAGENEPNEQVLAKIHRWLFDYEYDRNIIRRPYVTSARRIIQQSSQRGLDDWLMEIVASPHPLDNLREEDQRMDDSFKKLADGTFEKSMDGWPDMLNYARAQESYDRYRKRKGMSATTPTYNITQLKAAFVGRRILRSDAKSARVRSIKEEWVNGVLRKVKQQIYIHEFPTREDIAYYLKERFGFEVNNENDISSQMGSNSPEGTDSGPDF